MARVLLVRELRSRTTVKIHNDIDTGVIAPPYQAVEILNAAAGEELALLDEIFADPEANGDADRVETQTLDLADVVLGDPAVPVLLERGVGGILAELLDARPLVVEPAAAHAGEFVRGHPWLDDELRAEIDAAKLVVAWEPGHDAFSVSAEDCVQHYLSWCSAVLDE